MRLLKKTEHGPVYITHRCLFALCSKGGERKERDHEKKRVPMLLLKNMNEKRCIKYSIREELS